MNVAAFFVDDGIRQAEFWNLRADHAARFRILVEDHAMVAKRGKIAGDGERGRAAADQGYAFAIFLGCGLWQTVANVVFVVGRDSFQAANSHRLLLYACAPARWLAGAVARATENSRKDIRAPVDHVRVGIPAVCNQTDIFRDGRMCRASPLAVHHLVEVVRLRNVGILH